MKILKEHTPHGYTVIYPASVVSAKRFEIHFEGYRGIIVREQNETVEQVWARVEKWVSEKREQFQNQKYLLNPRAEATIYAGELETACADKLYERHLAAIIIDRLHAETFNHRDGTGTSRTSALSLLAKLNGIAPTPKKRVTPPKA